MPNEGETLSTAIATVTLIPVAPATSPYGVAIQGQGFEAVDPQEWGPVVGDAVLVDYLPSSGQWVIVAII